MFTLPLLLPEQGKDLSQNSTQELGWGLGDQAHEYMGAFPSRQWSSGVSNSHACPHSPS